MDHSYLDSETHELIGSGSYDLNIPIGSKIIHVDILQSGTASNSWLECGGMLLAKNYARDSESELAFTSTTTCTIWKTGTDDSTFSIVYVPPNATSSWITYDKQADIYIAGIFLFCFLLWFFRGIFHVNRYE